MFSFCLIYEEVLPSIRQTSAYGIQQATPQLDPNLMALVQASSNTLAAINGVASKVNVAT